MNKPYLDAVWEQVKNLPQSPSHDTEHLERVLGFSKELQARYGGDYDVVVAAAMLHDLGRVDVNLPSAESAQEAASKAEGILREVGFPADKITHVCSAIRQHDQEDLIPDSIEGVILKEADFLAGFGAWGILRIAMFQGERRKSVYEILYRLREKMPARIASLQFPESRLAANQEYLFVKFFLSLLDETPSLPQIPLTGRYVVFEGISGSGKDTQINKLCERLDTAGKETVTISEPSKRFRELVSSAASPEEQLYILLADRTGMAQSILGPALEAGKFVISSRSYVSALVYQVTPENSAAYIRFLHRSLPSPDLIVFLDVPAETAYERIMKRKSETGQPLGRNEALVTLARHRQKYLEAIADFDQSIVVDGTLSIDAIAEKVWQSVASLVGKEDLNQ